MNDWQLLDDYARTGSETAFAQVVERYLGLVHSAAQRQVQNDALAADVSQAVFLLLARKAGSFRQNVVLSGWLFRTTRYVAARAQRSEARRQRREQEAHSMHELHADNPNWSRLAPEVDDALSSLGESDRNALLLRFAEGRNHREIGAALGVTEVAARQRVNRALEKLRGALSGKGIALTVTILAGLLAERLVAAPPSDLAGVITRGVVSGAAGAQAGGGVTLAAQVAAAWRRTRIQWTVAVGAVVVVIAALLFQPTRSQTSSARAAQSVSSNAQPAAASSLLRRAAMDEYFRLTVVSSDTGEPLSGARVMLNFVVNAQWLAPDALVTDAQGVCVIPLPRGDLARLDVGAHVAGYENRFFTWRIPWQHPRPKTYTLRLGRAETVGGEIVDEQRRPIGGVSVWLTYSVSDTSWREPEQDQERLGFVRRIELGATDAQGRWSCDTIPPTAAHYGFEFEHPDYVRHTSLSFQRETVSAAAREQSHALRAGKAVTVLRRGLMASGLVVDTTGQPIAMARIATAWHEGGVSTDADGQFTLRQLAPGLLEFVATAAGYAPRQFQVTGGSGPVRVVLEPGGLLRVRILNDQKEPIEGATLLLDEGFGAGSLGWDDVTDAAGWVVWSSAPRNETRVFTAYAPGYEMARGLMLRTDGTDQTVTLRPEMMVVGTVLDAATGEPVTRFKAIPGQGEERPNFDRGSLYYGTNGLYRLRFSEGGLVVVRIEAEGYTTEWARPYRGAQGEPRCDFKLRREDPASGVRGIVRNPDGSPAAGAQVVLCTLENGALLARGSFRRDEFMRMTNADGAGRFEFPPTRALHTVAAVSEAGFGSIAAEPGATLELPLQSFGTIEGVVRRDGQPLAGQTVQLVDPSYNDISGAVSIDAPSFQARTDAEGRFRLEAVPTGDLRLSLSAGLGKPFTDETPVSVQAGRTVSVVVGEPEPGGRTIIGRLKASESGIVSDWRPHVFGKSLSRIVRAPTPPPGLSEEASKLWLVRWHQSPEGIALRRGRANYDLVFTSADEFMVRGVPSGEYRLSVTARAEGQGGKGLVRPPKVEWTGYVLQNVVVPEATPVGADAPLDLGEVEVKIKRYNRN